MAKPNPHNKCDNLRATLTRRIDKGAPAIGANAWRKRNVRLTADMKHWCSIAANEDSAVLDDLVPPPTSLAPAGFDAGAVGVQAPQGLTGGEVARYAAIGLTGVAALVMVTVVLTR